MKNKNPFLKALPWIFVPTLCLYIIISFYDLSFTSFIQYFKEIKQFRLFILILEVLFYFGVSLYYKNRSDFN